MKDSGTTLLLSDDQRENIRKTADTLWITSAKKLSDVNRFYIDIARRSPTSIDIKYIIPKVNLSQEDRDYLIWKDSIDNESGSFYEPVSASSGPIEKPPATNTQYLPGGSRARSGQNIISF
jgi:hypothetical protein